MIDSRRRFTPIQRLLHWLMALCILAILFIGVGMVTSITPRYLALIQIHKTLGIAILALAIIRLALRMIEGAPPLPPDLPFPLKFAAESSQYVLYLFMLGMPLLGWAMLSAASHPVVLFGSVHLPSLLPVNPHSYTLLRRLHTYLGMIFFVLILAHIAGLLFHKLVRNDGIFETMAPRISKITSDQ